MDAALLIQVATGVAAVAALVLSGRANAMAGASLEQGGQQIVASARAEIIGYARKMTQLDRQGARRNGHEIGILGQQCDSLIQVHGHQALGLVPGVYRLISQNPVLDTDELELAERMASEALRG